MTRRVNLGIFGMKIMTRAANYTKVDSRKPNYAMQIREKLGLGNEATEADVIAAVKKLEQDIGIARARVELARSSTTRKAEDNHKCGPQLHEVQRGRD
jgi:hypothetical protein